MTLNKESTDELASQQKTFLAQWEEMHSKFDQRDDMNVHLVKFMDNVQLKALKIPEQLTPYEEIVLQAYEQEWDHMEIVNRVLRCLGNKRRHDWSKDYLYIFALAGKFTLKITDPEFLQQTQSEINRHHKLEPHHPQFEKLSQGSEINVLDIQEMAIDRLARSVWVNKGKVGMDDDMLEFMPEFYGNIAEAKLEKYKECALAFEKKVCEVYRDVMRETEENKLLKQMWEMM